MSILKIFGFGKDKDVPKKENSNEMVSSFTTFNIQYIVGYRKDLIKENFENLDGDPLSEAEIKIIDDMVKKYTGKLYYNSDEFYKLLWTQLVTPYICFGHFVETEIISGGAYYDAGKVLNKAKINWKDKPEETITDKDRLMEISQAINE